MTDTAGSPSRVRAEVKGLVSLDLPDGKSLPEDPRDCTVRMQADIGPVGDASSDTFDFLVSTPSALSLSVDDNDLPRWTAEALVLPVFSWEAVEASLDEFVRAAEGESWAAVVEHLVPVLA